MEDRYLFRGKRTDNGEWVEGFLVKPRIGNFTNIVENPEVKGEQADVYEIEPSTICQCTGLEDKNGKLIWENDILSGHIDSEFPENETRKRVVWYENGWCTNEYGCADYEELDDFDSENFEVIGNVVDNPELLEVRMTESEAIEFMKRYLDTECYTDKCVSAHNMAIKALEEIQQYRAIGTVEEKQKQKIG